MIGGVFCWHQTNNIATDDIHSPNRMHKLNRFINRKSIYARLNVRNSWRCRGIKTIQIKCDVDRPPTKNSFYLFNYIDSAPKTLGNSTLRWQATPRLSAAAQWEHVGSYYMDASNTQKYDGHDLINLALNLNVREGVSLEGRVLNLFDEDYAKRADVWFGDKRYFPGEPRRFMFAVKAAY